MWQLLKKEFLHILRDRGLVIFLVYIFTVDIYLAATGFKFIPERIAVAVLDEDRSGQSRELASRILPPTFQLPVMVASPSEADALLEDARAVVAMTIPHGFSRDLARGEASVQVLVDGTQSTAAYLSSAYLGRIASDFELDARLPGMPTRPELPVELKSRVLFNPTMSDELFEGLNEFFMVVTIMAMILPAAVLIREREYGTIDQILISPVDIRKMLLMKVAASVVVLLCCIALCHEVVLRGWIGFELKGSLWEFLLVSLVYCMAMTGFAFIISSAAERFTHVGMLTIAIFAPMLLLAGGWVPPEALPGWLRSVTFISPLKHYMELGIGLLVRGAGIEVLWQPLLKLMALGSVVLAAGYVVFVRKVIAGR